MCGIVGYWDQRPRQSDNHSLEYHRRVVQRMAGAILHRGPDDSGDWVDESTPLVLGFRRLAIVDLSPAGRQPMVSASGRSVLTFNGEIYNVAGIRRELIAARRGPFRGHSDTEVLVEAIELWGMEATLRKCAGMFALAYWNRPKRQLQFARDRFGEKPLYYGYAGGSLVWASELKSLHQHPDFEGTVDRAALTQYFRFGYVPGPLSIYEEVRKLPPATILTLNESDVAIKQFPEPKEYWSLSTARVQAQPIVGTEEQAADECEQVLRQTIREQMVADVPLGAFLSGGIDSALIVSLMQSESERPVRTFTIGFHESRYDEAPHAQAIARHLRTEHTELYVTAEQSMEIVPRLPTLYDEPFADASQIPTWLVSQMAREHVTVALSGDGGDEMFCGYDRYHRGLRFWQVARRLPPSIRSGMGRLGNLPWLRSPPGGTLLRKAHWMTQVVPQATLPLALRSMVSIWKNPEELVIRGAEPPSLFDQFGASFGDEQRQMMELDTATYLADDILVKVDRAAMGVGLETRAPYLDHRVAEFSYRLPSGMLTHNGHGKQILRNVLSRFIPRKLFERPKQGFGVPVGAWLRGSLRPWAEELLSPNAIRQDGFLHADVVQRHWREHLSGTRDWSAQLWSVLMFQAWTLNRRLRANNPQPVPRDNTRAVA